MSTRATGLPAQEGPVDFQIPEDVSPIDDDRSEGQVIPYSRKSYHSDAMKEKEGLPERSHTQREGLNGERDAKNNRRHQEVLPVLDDTVLPDSSTLPTLVESVPRFFDRFPVGAQPVDELESDQLSESDKDDHPSAPDVPFGSEMEDLHAWEMRLPIPSSNEPVLEDDIGERLELEAGPFTQVENTGVIPIRGPSDELEKEEDEPSVPSVVDEEPKPIVVYVVPQVLFPGFDAIPLPSSPDETTLQEEVGALAEVEINRLNGVEPVSLFTSEDEMNVALDGELSREVRNSLSILEIPSDSKEETTEHSDELKGVHTFLEESKLEEQPGQSEESTSLTNDFTKMTDIRKYREPRAVEPVHLPKLEVAGSPEISITPNLEEDSEERVASTAELAKSLQAVLTHEEGSTQRHEGKRGGVREGQQDTRAIRQFPVKNQQDPLFQDENPTRADDSGETVLSLETSSNEGDQKMLSHSRNVEADEGEIRVRETTKNDQERWEPTVPLQTQEPQVVSTPSEGQKTELLEVEESIVNGQSSPRSSSFTIGAINEDSQQLPSQTMTSSPREFLGCQRGRSQLARHQYQEAILSFSQSLEAARTKKLSDESDFEMQDCFRQRAYTYLQLNVPNEALSDISYVLKRSQSDDIHRHQDIFFRGRLHVILHDFQEAIDDLTLALKLGLEMKARAYAHYLRGISYLRLRKIEPGLQDVSQGCRQDFVEACQLLEQIL